MRTCAPSCSGKYPSSRYRDACLSHRSSTHAAERLLPFGLSMLGLRCRFDIDLTDEQFKVLGDKVGLKNVGGQARILWAGVM